MVSIKGTSRNDKISGASEVGGSNEIYGLQGDDSIVGGFLSSNVIWGGFGNETLERGSASDVLHGAPGQDLLRAYFGSGTQLHGDAGDDMLEGNARGGCLLDGGKGND